ncbi:RSP_7527 family protein [Marinobacter sp.]|uniref:RSP_7527 family protein n=1 Tax=Marinobacter sp. TaxID=50741 RepID=UPI00385169C5
MQDRLMNTQQYSPSTLIHQARVVRAQYLSAAVRKIFRTIGKAFQRPTATSTADPTPA